METPLPDESSVAPPPADVAQQLALAHAAWKPLRRARAYALFDAWTLAIFGGLSLLCSFGSVVGSLLGIALCVAAYVEFKAAARLGRLDLAAPKRLAINQLALAGTLILYALWNLYLVSTGGGMLAELNAHKSELGDLGPEATQLFVVVLHALYGSLIGIAIFVQGGTAWYYASRAKLLQAYVGAMPDWVLQVHRDRGSI